MPVIEDREYRKALEFRAVEREEQSEEPSYRIEGYATTFDDPYKMYSFDGVDYFERVDSKAFDDADMSDVILQYDHQGRVYARQSNGTLKLSADAHGLKVEADLSSTEESRKLYEDVKAGLLKDMSFAFTVAEDAYAADTHTRTILRIEKLYDVSVVSIPANPGTEVSARTYFAGVAEREQAECLAMREAEEARVAEVKAEIAEQESEEIIERKADSEAEQRAITDELERRKAEEEQRNKDREEAAKVSIAQTTFEQKEEKHMFEIDSKEYRNAWLKNLMGAPMNEEERAGYTQTSTYATNAIPTIIANVFFEKMKKLAPMLSEITLMNAAGNLKFVCEGTRNAASSHTENSTLTPAADTTVSVTLGAVEFMKVVGISKSASMMSVDAFENWLVDLLAGDIARAIDDYIINGGSNGIADITWTSGTNMKVVASTGYKYADICELVALLPAAYDAEAKFLVNKATLWGKIAPIVNSSGTPIFVQDTSEGVGRILGYPVVVDDYVTTAGSTIYLGKLNGVVGNLSEGINVESDASAGFTSGSILYRGYASFDSAVAQKDAFVKAVLSV